MWRRVQPRTAARAVRAARAPPARWLHSAGPASYLRHPGSAPLSRATCGAVLAARAHADPGRTALLSLHEGVALTYEELLTQADALGCALREQGLQKGDRLGVWAHNCAGWLVAMLAAVRAGLIAVLINPVYEKEELTFCLRKTGVKSLFFPERLPSRDYYRLLQQIIPELEGAARGDLRSRAFPNLTSLIYGGKENLNGAFTLDSLVAQYRRRADTTRYERELAPEDGCLIHFTSGTTGEPKAALDSHLGVVNNTYFTGLRNSFHEGPHTICVQVPLFHALGSVVTALSGLQHGCRLVLAAPAYSLAANVRALLAEKCSVVTGTPTMFVDLVGALRAAAADPRHLRVALAAGAPCSPQLIRDMHASMHTEVKVLYGLTESTACVFQSAPGDGVERVADTVGYIQDHVEVKVVDERGVTVPLGAPGDLLVRGYNTMLGYWDEPDKTRRAFDPEGWLYTGDKFCVGADGYGRIVGRLKDIIVRGGENVAPKEIEDLLDTHPDVLESQVVGVADARLGEELCAVVRVREGARLAPDAVRRHLAGRLARYKIPRLLRLVDHFPKTASGKIQKYKLREMIESGKL